MILVSSQLPNNINDYIALTFLYLKLNMVKICFKMISVLAIGTGTTLLLAWYYLSKNKKQKPPKKWHKVGELSGLYIFPVKSFSFIQENSLECTQLGLKSGWLRDRTLMVIDHDKKFLTLRQHPKMVHIKPSVTDTTLTLAAPEMTSISIDLSNVGKIFNTLIYGQQVPASDCGNEVAKWLSNYLLQEESGLRLVYYPLDEPYRDISSSLKVFPLLKNEHAGAYGDESSYSLLNESSLAHLNTRLDEPITADQLRMNFIVKGAEPHDEDNWDWIKIGDVTFRNIRPCTRCAVTTVDPKTATKHPNFEPVKTLRKYRSPDDPDVRKFVKGSPVMGIHLGLMGTNGFVKINDPVYVGINGD